MDNDTRILRRLEREAQKERRRRERAASRNGRGRARRAMTADELASTDAGTVKVPLRIRHPWLRRLLIRAGIAAAALIAVLVIVPPLVVPVEGQVTSRFFIRSVPESIFLFDVEAHLGIDFGAPTGTRVRAARSGRVVSVSTSPTYGLVIDVRHPFGLVTRYAHLSAAAVNERQWVWWGRRIGSVGMSGRATGPHLHFEVRLGDRSLPPGFFLMFAQARRAIVGF